MKIRKGDRSTELENTMLQRGDRCVWITHHGTLAFIRGSEPLRTEKGDDKFLITPVNYIQVTEILAVVAGAANLTFRLDNESKGLVIFVFE